MGSKGKDDSWSNEVEEDYDVRSWERRNTAEEQLILCSPSLAVFQ